VSFEEGSQPVTRGRRHSTKLDKDLKGLSEEEIFLRILDLLERNDEFNSLYDDEGSTFGDEEQAQDDFASESEEDFSDEGFLEERPLEEWEMEAAWNDLQQRRLPNIEVCRRLISMVIRMYDKEQNVVFVPKPDLGERVVVVGDLHGHFSDFIHILTEHGEPQPGPGGVKYIFNGDFVDRGAWGPEVLLSIFCLKVRCPDGIFLNRGNHEDHSQNLKPDNGFVHAHCTRAFGADAQRVYALCRRSFKALPLCHVIDNDVAVLHGGLPLDSGIKLSLIQAIERRHAVPVQQCCIWGYPRFQKVVAQRDLLTEDGEQVFKGTPGKLTERVGNCQKAIARFAGFDEEVVVHIAGCPELEKDVEITYDSKADSKKHLLNRLFVALLWSDPVANKEAVGPNKRGAGSYFDARITQDFLRANKLSLMLRSHEKRAEGFLEEHRSTRMGLMSATVFSASNYPSGAGEPIGNKAAVVVLRMEEGRSLASTIAESHPWREAYDDDAFHEHGMSLEMKTRFQQVEANQAVGPRARAMAKLRELIYCSRPKLMTFWQRIDIAGEGMVPVADWARAMRACVVADDEFPWEWLTAIVLRNGGSTNFNYASYLTQYENALSRKLADQWHSSAVMLMADNVTTKEEAEAAWNQIDRNGDGKLSYQELRPLLRTSALAISDAPLEEDRVYSVLVKMDKNRTGFVDKAEFVRAVVRAIAFQNTLNAADLVSDSSSVPSPGSPDISPLGLAHGAAVAERKVRNSLLRKELAQWNDADVANCWAATQGAIRALAATCGCASSVFQVLDGDGDGAIDRQEFQRGLMQLLRGSQLLKAFDRWEPLLWKLVDEDGSGFVSPSELNMAFSVRQFMSI